MKRRKQPTADEALYAPLFPDLSFPASKPQRRYKRIQQPIWTENKAQFIEHYLKYFVHVTRHGAYIDGFAGPQYPDRLDAWAAARVLASEPKRLRRFFLCDISTRKLAALRRLRDANIDCIDRKGNKFKRKIQVLPGDFNVSIDKILSEGGISQKEATFCLLDQHTFECHWASVRKLSEYKKPPQLKVELLYFLGVGWLHRAFSGVKHREKMDAWWGKSGWEDLPAKSSQDIADIVRTRMQTELGYQFSAAYPIYDKHKRVTYYMIHASDHDEAPALMVRAHAKAVTLIPSTQGRLKFSRSRKLRD
jgi:three-Cys-motif partner protein